MRYTKITMKQRLSQEIVQEKEMVFKQASIKQNLRRALQFNTIQTPQLFHDFSTETLSRNLSKDIGVCETIQCCTDRQAQQRQNIEAHRLTQEIYASSTKEITGLLENLNFTCVSI